MKLIKWTFGNGENKMYSSNLAVTDKLLISKGQYKGLQFDLIGFGLSKAEREIFNSKFMQFTGIWTAYIGRLIIQYNSKGIYDSLKNVNIYIDISVKDYITEWFKYTKKKTIDKIAHVGFKKQYNFSMFHYYEGEYKFTSDMLSAFQLASNYEADLYLNGKLILSPLGFEYQENKKLIEKYLSKRFVNEKRFNLMGYKSPGDKEIKNYKKVVYQY